MTAIIIILYIISVLLYIIVARQFYKLSDFTPSYRDSIIMLIPTININTIDEATNFYNDLTKLGNWYKE